MKEKLLRFYLFEFIVGIVLVALPSGAVFASQADGTVSGYAWSSQIGWINFGTTNGNVHITDSEMTGYAWNENAGWINLNPANSGVQNSGGTLSGYAWSEGIGWINFSGVAVSSSGVFSGTASGDNSVSFSFSCSGCSTTTDWRPASVRGSGGGGGGTPLPLIFSINNGQQYTNNQTVRISFSNGFNSSDKLIVSNSPDLSGATEEYFQKSRPWTLPLGDGDKTVYARVIPQYGVPSEITSGKIILDTTPPFLKITEVKDKYKPSEQVAVKGLTESGAEVGLLAGDKQGLFSSGKEGGWDVSLGQMLPGKYLLEFTPKDLAGNVGEPVKVEVVIEEESTTKVEPEKPSFFEKIGEMIGPIIEPLIPDFLKPAEVESPQKITLVPKTAPKAFRGIFYYLDEAPLERLVLAPLPRDFRMLAAKFPKLAKTFGKVGVRRFTDIGKLENAKLKLPGLTESVLPPAETEAGKFAPVKGIPVIALSESAKERIPSGVVFVKAGGGLVDVNAVLSLGDNGKALQTIEMIARQKLQLVVKTEKEAEKVVGYIVFKSKNRNLSADDLPKNTPVQLLAALGFIAESALAQEKGTEQRLVLDEFEYVYEGSGVYSVNIQSPAVDGTYEIITTIDYKDSSSEEIKLIAIVDPEGYIYKKIGDLEGRVPDAKVWLYWLNSETNQYEVWSAVDYQQENPQTTDERGTYSFLTPVGKYYLKVSARGYLDYTGEPFEVKEGIHINIEMKPKAWWLRVFDWKTILLLAILALLIYNFYRSIIKKRI